MTLVLSLVLAAAQATGQVASNPQATDGLKELKQASNKGDLATVERILSAKPEWAEAKDEAGVSFLLNALYRQRGEVVRAYVRRRKAFDLFEASALGRTKDLAALLKQHADVKSYSPDGFIALGLASFFAQPDAVRLLLANGADVNQYAKAPHVQALHSAAAGKCIECVRLLLEKGADPNSPQDGGFRPLHETAANNDRAMAELLISKGALPDIKDDKGKTSADFARERGHPEMAAWLDSLKR